MIQIEKIEIKYFRSIYHATIQNLRDVAVFSGKNDCGKSNILRALNLFFNNHTGWHERLDFSQDFCQQRLYECRKTTKAKQFIRVKVHFLRGARYEKSLPEKFWFSRTWNRDSTQPIEKNSLREGEVPAQSIDRALASLQRYLGTIQFEYVPAVKDRSFFTYSLGILQDAILRSRRDDSLLKAVDGLNQSVKKEANELHREFQSVTGVGIDIHLPGNLEKLFQAFSITTGENNDFPLTVRGDGIQARFIPSLFHHVASRSNKTFIWGFEEPENCLEHKLATKLAKDITSEYSKESQVLLTSHSPAFISLPEDGNSSIYRVFSNNNLTDVVPIESYTEELHSDLGLLELQREYQSKVREEMEIIRKAKEAWKRVANEATTPILLVEGKSDVTILNKAWERLNPNTPCSFRITSCDVSGDAESETRAGCGVLGKALDSCRPDLPITVGLFDYDDKGIKTFGALSKSFKANEEFPGDIKLSSNNHVAAFVIPDIQGKEDYRRAKNLPIEFIFPEDAIVKQVQGKGLVLEQKKKETRIESLCTGEELTTEPHYRKIKEGKVYFAEKVVPTFNDGCFGNFKAIFDLIQKIIGKLTQMER